MEAASLLRRSARRIVRRDWPYRPLPESELELLRFVTERPGARVRDAARSLGVAQNTVSTLVGRLVDRGLLVRGRHENDARAASLMLTATAKRRMRAWRDRRSQVVDGALASLDPEDRHAIQAALPSLRRLVAVLEGSE